MTLQIRSAAQTFLFQKYSFCVNNQSLVNLCLKSFGHLHKGLCPHCFPLHFLSLFSKSGNDISDPEPAISLKYYHAIWFNSYFYSTNSLRVMLKWAAKYVIWYFLVWSHQLELEERFEMVCPVFILLL